MPNGDSYIFNASQLNDKTYDDIMSAIGAATNGAVVLKGTLGTGGTIDALPAAGPKVLGHAYKVVAAGIYDNNQAAKFGDLFICYESGASSYAWMLIPAGDDIEDTWRPIKVGSTELTDGSTTFEIAAGSNVGLSFVNGKLTISSSYNDTGATSVETTGTGNAVTSASYDASTRKITLTKGNTFVDLSSTQTISGNKTFTGRVITTNNLFEIRGTSATDDSWIKLTNAADTSYYAFGIRRPYANYGLQMKYHPVSGNDEYYNIWHAGNDGSGSGLDADLLDGKHATSSLTSTDDNNVPTSKAVADYIDGLGYVTGSYLPLAGGNMTGAGGIQYPTDNSDVKPNYFISAGAGYSAKSGKFGVKLLCCDQSDCQSGLGQDCSKNTSSSTAGYTAPTAFDYDFWVIGGNNPSKNSGYISFGFHTKDERDYKRVGYWDYNGNLYTTGSISEAGTTLSSKYLGINSKAADSDKLDGKDSSVFVQATKNASVSVVGNTKDTYTYDKTTIFAPNGLIMGGTAASAGLVTRGICGATTPNATTGAANKDHLYLNYDGNNTWNAATRAVIINAGDKGTDLGSGMYQYAAVRGDIVKAWVEAKGYLTSDDTKDPTEYYWANIKVSSSSSTETTPTFKTATISNGTNSCTISAPNSATTYGSIAVTGGKDDYCGINFGNTSSRFTIMDNGAHMGIYNGSHGWTYCYEYASSTIGLGGYGNNYSGAQGYKINLHSNTQVVGKIFADQFRGNSWSCSWYQGRDSAVFRNIAVSGYHALWSLKTTNGSWDFGEYSTSGWHNVPVLTYIQDSHYDANNNTTTYQIKFPLASGTIALTGDIPSFSGTEGYIPKFTGTNTIGNSSLSISTHDSLQISSANTRLVIGNLNGTSSTDWIHAYTYGSCSQGIIFDHNICTTAGHGGGTLGTSSFPWKGLYLNGNIIKSGYTLTLPSKTGTVALTSDISDTKVTQAYSTTNAYYPLLFSATSGISSTSSRGATTTILCNKIYANPSTGLLETDGLVTGDITCDSLSSDGSIYASGSIETEGRLHTTRYVSVYDDNDEYQGTDNFGGGDVDTKYYAKGITVDGGYHLSFPANSGTIALTSEISNYYWANVKISSSSSTTTTPTFGTVTLGTALKFNNSYIKIGNVVSTPTTTGNLSIGIGTFVTASNANTVAIGNSPNSSYPITASGSHAIAIGNGYGVTSSGTCSIAIGSSDSTSYTTTCSANYAIKIGRGTCGGLASISIGNVSNTSYDNTVVVGSSSTASGIWGATVGNNSTCWQYSVAYGADSYAYPYATAIGYSSKAWNYGVALGYDAHAEGTSTTADYAGIAIGYNAKLSATNYWRRIVIGTNASVGSHDYTTVIGKASSTAARQFLIGDSQQIHCAHTSIVGSSDGRDKTDIKTIDDSILPFIKDLRPVTFLWNRRSDYVESLTDVENFDKEKCTEEEIQQHEKFLHHQKVVDMFGFDSNAVNKEKQAKKERCGHRRQLGFIAQDVLALYDKHFNGDKNRYNLVYSNLYDLTENNDMEETTVDGIHQESLLAMGYTNFIPLIVKAIQEQQEIIEKQQQKIQSLEERLLKLESLILGDK